MQRKHLESELAMVKRRFSGKNKEDNGRQFLIKFHKCISQTWMIPGQAKYNKHTREMADFALEQKDDDVVSILGMTRFTQLQIQELLTMDLMANGMRMIEKDNEVACEVNEAASRIYTYLCTTSCKHFSASIGDCKYRRHIPCNSLHRQYSST